MTSLFSDAVEIENMAPLRRVVVFDIDDTLYPEFDYVRSGLMSAAQHVDTGVRNEFVEAYLNRFRAGQRSDLFQAAGLDCGFALDDDLLQEMLHAYREHQPGIALSPEVKSLLDHLSERSWLAAISDGDATRQARKVEALGLRKWIDPIVLTGALGPGHGKPSRTAFEMIENHFPAAKGFSYVADNSFKDFVAPVALGWTCIQLIRPNRVHESPAFAGATVVATETEMAKAIKRYLMKPAS